MGPSPEGACPAVLLQPSHHPHASARRVQVMTLRESWLACLPTRERLSYGADSDEGEQVNARCACDNRRIAAHRQTA